MRRQPIRGGWQKRWDLCFLLTAHGLLLTADCLLLTGRVEAQPPAFEEPLVTGQQISLDLKGVDILDVLKLLSQKSGLNFVAGRNVSGRVTIFVSDADVWDVFELIVGANDLAYERRGDIVTVMMARDYELIYGNKFQARTKQTVRALRHAKVAQVATVLNQIKSAVGRVVADETTNTLILDDVPARLGEMEQLLKQLDRPVQTKVFSLNYAQADTLREKVQELLSPVGTFTFDARTNQAIISDLPEVIRKASRVVRAFDVPDGEVLIDARIVKVALTDDMSLGIEWERVLSGIDATVGVNFSTLDAILGGTAAGSALKAFTTPDAKLVLEAIQKLTKAETLSNPRILVSNNQEAKILVGDREAIVTTTTTVPSTGSTVSSPTIDFVDVGTKLYVTPNVKRDGNIQLKIKPEVSTSRVVEFSGNRIPIVTSTEAETNVLVKSGSTLILGGLIDTKHSVSENKLPVLGDLPFLGGAFRSTVTEKKKTELVLFLTPKIILPDGSEFVPTPLEELEELRAWEEALESSDSPLPLAYRLAVRRRLESHLREAFRHATLTRGSAVLSFVLSHEGGVIGPQDVTSPQGEPFVQAASSAFAKAQPFPPFPEGVEATEVRFRLAVEYEPIQQVTGDQNR